MGLLEDRRTGLFIIDSIGTFCGVSLLPVNRKQHPHAVSPIVAEPSIVHCEVALRPLLLEVERLHQLYVLLCPCFRVYRDIIKCANL
jgi:hypothetical protein